MASPSMSYRKKATPATGSTTKYSEPQGESSSSASLTLAFQPWAAACAEASLTALRSADISAAVSGVDVSAAYAAPGLVRKQVAMDAVATSRAPRDTTSMFTSEIASFESSTNISARIG